MPTNVQCKGIIQNFTETLFTKAPADVLAPVLWI